MGHILLPDIYPGYLERFTKQEYGHEFKKYCESTMSFYDALELRTDESVKAASVFVDCIGSTLPRIFGRKLALYDISRFLFLYTVPAALAHGSEAANLFADALISEWNSRYGAYTVNKSDFSAINSGFKTRIMGFDMRE